MIEKEGAGTLFFYRKDNIQNTGNGVIAEKMLHT